MAKQAYVYSGTDWVPLASEVTNLSNYQLSNGVGLKKIIPTSVAVGSGSGSASASGTVTFTGASSVSLNDVFSTTYDNYKIIINVDGVTTTAQNLSLRLRTGSDDSGANYYQSGFFNNSNASTYTGEANTGQTSFATTYLTVAAGDHHFSTIEMFNPNLAKDTLFTSLNGRSDGTASAQLYRAGALNTSTQYTGFTIFVTTTITGTVSVYGYNK
jgi:hypothetical protein